jgi:NAD(P)-dependent dehydrogenase (short-subunit alcohol dehydrogenase family)
MPGAQRQGQLMPTEGHEAEDPPRLSTGQRRTALGTGGTDGIGKAIALELALAPMQVVIVGSDAEKGMRAERDLRVATGSDSIHFIQADLSLMRDVDRLAAQIAARWPMLDRLVLCAGIVRGRYRLTAEGVETNFAVNYLGRFALTAALLPCLAAGGLAGDAARIVMIGGAAQNGRINYNNVNLTGRFNVLRVVSQFCGANDVFVIEQARRIAAARPPLPVTITALKVGVVRTNIRRQFPLWMKLLVPLLFDPLLACSPQQIAASARRLLLDPEFEGVTGAFYRHIKRFKSLAPGRRTNDAAQGRLLWDFSQRLIAGARAAKAG